MVTVSSGLPKVERVDLGRVADQKAHREDPKVRVDLVIPMSHHQLSPSLDEARAAAEDARMNFNHFVVVICIPSRLSLSFI
mmetsp:Transcript_10982/g.16904  ORF Transcript_10982/g.16904 Transcript_10982/m.16904 type:complete len:81 (+) Transcript_10982:1504-1746(+)